MAAAPLLIHGGANESVAFYTCITAHATIKRRSAELSIIVMVYMV
jgi:hypothetical protein